MNRTTIIVITLVVVVILGIGGIVFLSFTPAAPVEQPGATTPPYTNSTNSTVSVDAGHSKEAVQAAYLAELAKYPSDNTKLYEISIVGDYALQVWAGDVMGGQALLKYDISQSRWVLVSGGGGVWSVDTLVTLMGVPQDVAAKLLIGLSQ